MPKRAGEQEMVHKSIQFTEYVFEGRKFQWATIRIGSGKNAISIQVNYDERKATEEHFTLRLKGVPVILCQDYSDFDNVFAHVNERLVVFYEKERGFNILAVANNGQYLKW